jgi:hypothetical protein
LITHASKSWVEILLRLFSFTRFFKTNTDVTPTATATTATIPTMRNKALEPPNIDALVGVGGVVEIGVDV